MYIFVNTTIQIHGFHLYQIKMEDKDYLEDDYDVVSNEEDNEQTVED
jgi:hypothetical protein